MSDNGTVIVVGGTRAIGLEIVKHFVRAGREVVLTGRTPENVESALAAARAEVGSSGGSVRGVVFDLAEPTSIAPALADVRGPIRHLALVAIVRDANSVADYSIERAIRLVTLKLVGFTEVVHTLRDRLEPTSSIVLFGGMAKERPYPGSTTVSTVNGGISGLTRTLVEELKPIRVNAIHPGIVGDSPFWAEKPEAIRRYESETPTGKLSTMAEVVDAVRFLLENGAVNGVELIVDNGWHCR